MIGIDGNICECCGTCVGVCPVDALTISGHSLVIDRDRCVTCGSCVDVCPVAALKEIE